jgi:PPIC-type PPIASE domain
MMQRWLRSPIVHFVLIGGLLFAGRASWRVLDRTPTSQVKRAPIMLSGQQIRQLHEGFERRWGAMPTRGQLQALIEQAVEDELLYREARLLRLDFQDRSVRQRLIQKMRALSADPRRSEEELYREAVALGLDEDLVIQRLLRQKMRLLLQQDSDGMPLRDQDMRQYMERHRDRFVQPATVTFSHVFLSSRVRGDRLQEETEAVLVYLRARGLPPEATDELSDPFPLGRRFQAQARRGVARHFGENFATQIFELAPESWSGPIASPFGRHLVWVHEQVPERMPALEAVRQQVAYAVMEERAEARLTSGLQRLRRLYDIRVEIPDDTTPPGTSLTRAR